MGLGGWMRKRTSRSSVSFDEMAATSLQRAEWLGSEHHGLAKIYQEHDGRILHKWVHYFEVYERYFSVYRGTPLRRLEIGVPQGGSLELWRKYFGPDAAIYGVDINAQSAACVDEPNKIMIGSQADPVFLNRVIEKLGSPNIVLDDGSHIAEHQIASFKALYPALKEGGLYVLEDLHTSYWKGFQGGYQRAGTAIELAKQLTDDLHHWYHGELIRFTTDIGAVHVHDSMVIIEKRAAKQPMHLHVGKHAPADGSPPTNADLFPPRARPVKTDH